jgi:alkylation response protein AidB-like acyl-CoA dehydrogenase
MDHTLSESQLLLQRTVTDFFAREFPLDRLRLFHENRESEERALWDGISNLGWNAAPFPEEIGGFPGSLAEAAVILEAMGYAAAPSPYLHSTIAVGVALASHGHPLATPVAESQATIIRTPVARDLPESDGPVTDRVLGIRFANLTTHFVVPSPFAGGALIAADAMGVSWTQPESSGAEPMGILELRDAPVEHWLAASLIEDIELNGAAGSALMIMGAAQRSLDLAVAYMKERKQFGKLIGQFQALQHKAADMEIRRQVGRYLAYKASTLHGTPEFARSARYAQAWAAEAGSQVCRDAMQIHGGVGFIDDHKVQLPFKLAMSLANAYGTPHEHRSAIADLVLTSGHA